MASHFLGETVTITMTFPLLVRTIKMVRQYCLKAELDSYKKAVNVKAPSQSLTDASEII